MLRAAIALVPALVALLLPAPAAAEPAFLGFNEGGALQGSLTDGETAELTHAAVGSGAVVRYGISWRAVDGSGWQPYDELYAALRARGLRPLPIVNDAPRRTNLLCLTPPCPPTRPHYGDWGRFVSDVAARYPDSVAIEVWNEPNLRSNWNTLLGPDPRWYAKIFGAATKAVGTVDPSMPVLVGGLAPVARNVLLGRMTVRTFLSRFYAGGGASALRPVDGISMHPYPARYDLTQEKLMHPNSGLSKYLRDVREVRDARDPAGSARALWVTEVGWSMTGPRAISEAQQEQGLMNVLDVLGAMPDVRSILIHRLADPPPAPFRPPAELGFGLLRRDLSPKRSYCAVAAKLGQPVPAGC
ncbi:MAG: hypothetical protein ACRDK9_02365 [Solirubrobacterales bacterium]